MNSITGFSPITRSRNDTGDSYFDPNLSMTALQAGTSIQALGTNITSFTTGPLTQPPAAMPGSFFDDGATVPLTWDRLVEDTRLSVESYRQAISNGERAEYVRRAEDISDHVRLLLAAGSGTTDNHSGTPSIISSNKALYPHFRDMMSRFSKLVLSSHIAAADWPSADSYSKCLQEADAVLHGVYGYVEVARQQRGEDIPRLIPGFVVGSTMGGNWRNNGLGPRDPMSSTFIDQDDYEAAVEPNSPLDPNLLERLEELKRMISTNIRRLDEQLIITDKIITDQRHEAIADSVCSIAKRVIDCFRPYLATIESINLAPLGSSPQNPQLIDFAAQKQRLYDSISDLMLACQAVAGPLGDEWAAVRGDPLESRLNSIRTIAKQLETCTTQISFSLQLLQEMIPCDQRAVRDSTFTQRPHQRSQSRQARGFSEDRPAVLEGVDPATENYRKGENSKVKKFFGEEPAPSMPPWFLRLDHENEISYDMKPNPPQLRGGTMVALVEQLTRHDRLDSPFNNTFLLTYRSFTTASELFDLLVKRFSIQPPSGLNPDEFQVWTDKKQKPIRFRVVNILKSWFDTYWMEGQDESSKELIRRVHAFAKESVETTGTPGAQPLMAVVEQRLRGQDSNAKRLVLTLNQSAPAPIMPRNMRKLKFLDIDTTEFARQLTIIESRLYGKIKPTECLNKTWNKKAEDGAEPAENVKALILHSNQLTNWVAEMILNQADVKRRVVVIKHFISVAEV
jgi:son of sevenless